MAGARDTALFLWGNGGMYKELFIKDRPDMAWVTFYTVLILGPAVFLAVWHARNPPALPDTPSQPSESASQSPTL
jgi:hypothetical protein